jgi:hypothetical protein
VGWWQRIRDQSDAPEGAVGAAVQPVSVGTSGADRNWRNAAESGEGGFGAQPVGVVAGGDEQLSGGVGDWAGSLGGAAADAVLAGQPAQRLSDGLGCREMRAFIAPPRATLRAGIIST